MESIPTIIAVIEALIIVWLVLNQTKPAPMPNSGLPTTNTNRTMPTVKPPKKEKTYWESLGGRERIEKGDDDLNITHLYINIGIAPKSMYFVKYDDKSVSFDNFSQAEAHYNTIALLRKAK